MVDSAIAQRAREEVGVLRSLQILEALCGLDDRMVAYHYNGAELIGGQDMPVPLRDRMKNSSEVAILEHPPGVHKLIYWRIDAWMEKQL